jgi:SRSO17 transposase
MYHKVIKVIVTDVYYGEVANVKLTVLTEKRTIYRTSSSIVGGQGTCNTRVDAAGVQEWRKMDKETR